MWTTDGKLIEVNDEFTRLYGWTREEAVGRTAGGRCRPAVGVTTAGKHVEPLDRGYLRTIRSILEVAEL